MLKCPNGCKIKDTTVIDSRDYGDYIRRRRQCRVCGLRQTTYERVEEKRGLLKEDEIKIKNYRVAYPKDGRSDKDILKGIKDTEGISVTQLIFGVVWLKGQFL
jgi:hypothetical protein